MMPRRPADVQARREPAREARERPNRVSVPPALRDECLPPRDYKRNRPYIFGEVL